MYNYVNILTQLFTFIDHQLMNDQYVCHPIYADLCVCYCVSMGTCTDSITHWKFTYVSGITAYDWVNMTACERVNLTAPEWVDMMAPELVNLMAPERVDMTAPEQVNLTAPEGLNMTAPERVNLTDPGWVNMTAPEQVNVTAPEWVNMTVLGWVNMAVPQLVNLTTLDYPTGCPLLKDFIFLHEQSRMVCYLMQPTSQYSTSKLKRWFVHSTTLDDGQFSNELVTYTCSTSWSKSYGTVNDLYNVLVQ